MGKRTKSNNYCSAYNCKSFYESGGAISMHTFPRKGENQVKIINKFGVEEVVDRHVAWIKKLKIGKEVSKSMVICSLHFSEKNYKTRVPGKVYRKLYLRPDAVPDQSLPATPQHGSLKKKKAERRKLKRKLFVDDSGTDEKNSIMQDVILSEVAEEQKKDSINEVKEESVIHELFLSTDKKTGTCDVEMQTCPVLLDKKTQTLGSRYVKQILQEDKEHQVIRRFMSYEFLNDEEFEYFCGISRSLFCGLLDLLDREQCSKLKYFDTEQKNTTPKRNLKSMSIENQLLMTLARLRRGFSEEELAIFFQVSQSTVSRILTTWFQFLYLEFKKYSEIMFHCGNNEDIPHCFKHFKNLAVIIDCTELEIEMSSHFQQQGNTYSSYKSRNTVKFLVGINVHGGISFVSEGFEGCISDREIVIKSGFLNFLNAKETVLADRGFTIRDVLDPLGVKLVIPAFLDGRDALTPAEELETKYIARSRIHVERTMHLIKSFVIFKLPVKINLLPMISQMFFVACFLVNFQKPYVS